MVTDEGTSNRSFVVKAALAGTAFAVVVGGALLIGELFDDDSGEPAANPPPAAGPSGEKENPLGPTTPPPPSSDETVPPTTGPPNPSSATSLPCSADENCLELSIPPPAMILIDALAQVRGFGSDVDFKWSDPEFGSGLKTTGDQAVLKSIEASCLLIRPIVVNITPGIGGPVPISKFEPEGLTAGLRANQFNHVSIGIAGGIVAGGFSMGGEGRGNSQQWPIEGGTFEVETFYDDVLDTPDKFTLLVRWSGTSIENYTGEEGAGTVGFACIFAVEP